MNIHWSEASVLSEFCPVFPKKLSTKVNSLYTDFPTEPHRGHLKMSSIKLNDQDLKPMEKQDYNFVFTFGLNASARLGSIYCTSLYLLGQKMLWTT